MIQYIAIMENFVNNSIFWVELDKVRPNPFQPRKEFNEGKLEELSDSIRQYGILQPLVVTRHEIQKEDGGLATEYELIAGERRLRASRIAGLPQVPVIIRTSNETDKMKLELAIIENLQREDLNPIDRARAFKQLVDKFGLKHGEVGKKVGKSREYVSNTIRLLNMPDEVQQAILDGKMSEGHARPILMLTGKDEEQHTLFKEILYKKLTVREAESIAQRIAQDRVRKKKYAIDPEVIALEKQLTETLGTRVQIEQRDDGGKVHIDYFTMEDLHSILERMSRELITEEKSTLIEGNTSSDDISQEDEKESVPVQANTAEEPESKRGFLDKIVSFTSSSNNNNTDVATSDVINTQEASQVKETNTDSLSDTRLIDDRSENEKEDDSNDEDLYSVKNFSV